MEWSPSWKANSYSDDRKIFGIVRDPKVHNRVQKALERAHILCQINPGLVGPSRRTSLSYLCKGSVQVRGLFKPFIKCYFFYSDALLDSPLIPGLKNHSLPAVRNCLFNIFPGTLRVCRASVPSRNGGRAEPCCERLPEPELFKESK
jgi:hypothetical protein